MKNSHTTPEQQQAFNARLKQHYLLRAGTADPTPAGMAEALAWIERSGDTNQRAFGFYVDAARAEIERLRAALEYASMGLGRIHNSLLTPGPKQASGEMVAHFLESARAALENRHD